MPRRWKRSLTRTENSASSGDGAAATQAGYAHDLSFPGLWVGLLGDQRHLAVVVYKADARQALVGRTLVEVHHVEVAHVDALFREGLVEAHHQGFVFRPDRAYRHWCAVAQLLRGRRTVSGKDGSRFVGGLLRFVSGSCRTIRASRAIRRSGRGQKRVDVEFFDPGLLDDELARCERAASPGSRRRPAPCP